MSGWEVIAWPDIEWTVRVRPWGASDVSIGIEFEAFEQDGQLVDGTVLYVGKGDSGVVDDLDEADRTVWGAIKWDGCSQWARAGWHGCEFADVERYAEAMRRIYRLAPGRIPGWCAEESGALPPPGG
jgi:hypothetical protein